MVDESNIFDGLSNDLKSLIFDSSIDSVFVYDIDGNLIYLNDVAYKQLGYTKEELLDMNFYELDVPNYDTVFELHLKNLTDNGEFSFISNHYHKDGTEIILKINSRIVKYSDKKFVLSVARDITLEKNYKEELEIVIKKNAVELEILDLKERKREILTFQLNNLKKQLLYNAPLEDKLKLITDSVVNIFEADFARIWIVKKSDLCNNGCIHANVSEIPHVCTNRKFCLHLISSSGRYTNIDGDHRRVPLGSYKIGRIAAGMGSKFVTNDVMNDPMIHDQEWAKELCLTSFAGFKLNSKDDKPVGVLALFKKTPLDPDSEVLIEDLTNTISQVIISGNVERELRYSERKYRNIFENIQDIFYQTDNNGVITEISPSIERYSGYKPHELIGEPIEIAYFNPEDRNHLLKEIREKGEVVDYELQLKTKNNKLVYVSTNTHILFDAYDNPIGLEGSLRDITERNRVRKALKQSEQRLMDIIDFLPDATFAIDQEGKVIAWNRAIEEMTGTMKEDIMGKGDYAYVLPWYNERRPVIIDFINNDNSEYISKYDYVYKVGKTIYAEVFVPSVYNGKGAYLWVTASPLLDSKGHQYGAIESVRDITGRKKSEDKIKKSLEEKETLLREIHHRVKNNMQIISSLLNLQTKYVHEDESLNILKESQNRVKSMAMIHEKLYQTSDFTHINIAEYIKKLSTDLLYSYGIRKHQIILHIDIEDIKLNIETAIPVGLIINELISNSLKYAFPNLKGELKLSLKSKDDNYELIISDNGVGFPKELDFQNTESLGMQLVNTLTNQIDGTITLSKKNGAEFKIIFKELTYKKRI